MFKTSQQFNISSLCQLPCSACQTGPPGPLTPESTAGRYADNGGWLEGAMMIPSHMKRHLYYQEIAITQPNCVVLTNLFRLVIKSWFISLVSSLWLSSCLFFALLVLLPLIIFSRSCWLFPFSHHLYPLALLFHPSVIPLVFPSASIPASLIPTGVVIPSPQRCLNDFILPRLCLLPLMMCLLPSHFDVDYHSLLVCVCVCVGSRRGRNHVWAV